jgi:hypothetical protein
VRDIDTAEVDSLKVLDPNPPIREADIVLCSRHVSNGPFPDGRAAMYYHASDTNADFAEGELYKLLFTVE